MHVIGLVRHKKVVAGDGVGGQIAPQLRVRHDMIRAVGLVGTDIVEEDLRCVADPIVESVGHGTVAWLDVLRVSAPGKALPLEISYQVIWRIDPVGRLIIEDAEVGPRLQPNIVGLAGMQTWRIVILVAVGGSGQEHGVNVWAVRAALDLAPIVVLHDDQEHVADPHERIRCRRARFKKKEENGQAREQTAVHRWYGLKSLRPTSAFRAKVASAHSGFARRNELASAWASAPAPQRTCAVAGTLFST